MSGAIPIPWHRPMSGRDPGEEHRASTPLELFFDLCFVVAVAAVAATLHHDLAHDHLAGIGGFLLGFFSLLWGGGDYSWVSGGFATRGTPFPMPPLPGGGGGLVRA